MRAMPDKPCIFCHTAGEKLVAENALAQAVLDTYPVSIPLGSKRIELRPLVREDGTALAKFFARMPADERIMLKDDVTNPVVIATWCATLDPDKALPILALDGSRVVADATLHRDRRGWSRHVARIRLTVDPEYRRLGLGRAMVRELLVLAERLGIAVVCQRTYGDFGPAPR